MAQDDLSPPVTSSKEPKWASEARECYQDVVLALQQAQIPFAVGGAFAIHKHTGIWRTTKDLDLLLVASAVPEAIDQLRRKGFEAYIEDPVWLAKTHRGKYYVDLITGMGNASLIVEQSWIDRAEVDAILGIFAKVLRVEELIASKVFVAFRERFDGSDVVHLIRSCGEHMDWARLVHLLDSHWELLLWSLVFFSYVYPARTDLIPEHIWNELAGRLGGQIRCPDKEAPFRGSLVDPKMFAIDVSEWGERNLYREYCEHHPCLLRLEKLSEGQK